MNEADCSAHEIFAVSEVQCMLGLKLPSNQQQRFTFRFDKYNILIYKNKMPLC